MATKSTGTAVQAKRSGGNVVIASSDLTSAAIMELFAAGDVDSVKLTITAANPEETAKRIQDAKLAAESPEALFGSGTVSGKDYVGRVFRLDRVEWQAGDGTYTEGLPFYAVLHAVEGSTGEVKVIVCGARSVVLNAAIADARGWLPQWLKITSKRTSNNNDALDLVAAPADEVPFDR